MKDGSTFASAEVDTYYIQISSDEFFSTMEQLNAMNAVAVEPPKRNDDVYCLHEAGVYFESLEAGERVLISRRACDADFGEVVLPARALVDFAMKKLPSAEKEFDFVASLFDEMVEESER